MPEINADGGSLRELLCPPSERDALIRETAGHPAHTLNPAQIADLEALMQGAYSPLEGYMGRADYEAVLTSSCLANGLVWPVPIILAVAQATAESLTVGAELALRDEEGTPLALLTVAEIWQVDKLNEAQALLGSKDPEQPAVGALLAEPAYCLGGAVTGIQLPKHYDFTAFRSSPAQTRTALGEANALGFWLTHPPTASLDGLLAEAAKAHGARLVLGVNAGSDHLDPLTYAARARLARRLGERLGPLALVQLIPMECRATGVRGWLQRLLVMRNLGCSALALEAGSVTDEHLSELHALAQRCAMTLVLLPQTRGLSDADVTFNSHALYSHFLEGKAVDPWMIHAEDAGILRAAFPPRAAQGVVLFFTGLSGAGKSTVAKALFAALGAYDKPVTLLDGDIVRLNLSKGLGFSKEDRDTNILRIGYVASLVARSGGLAICAPIAPYRKTRGEVRRMVGRAGRFVEIHVATDLATCESRDPKGLYARARSGQLKGFTGIDDPYETPENPELRLDTGRLSVEQSIETILDWLKSEGYLV